MKVFIKNFITTFTSTFQLFCGVAFNEPATEVNCFFSVSVKVLCFENALLESQVLFCRYSFFILKLEF